MTDPRIQAFLDAGGKIEPVPMGCSALDPITGMAKSKLKNYLASRNNGAKASPKQGRPRKDCKKYVNSAILASFDTCRG